MLVVGGGGWFDYLVGYHMYVSECRKQIVICVTYKVSVSVVMAACLISLINPSFALFDSDYPCSVV